MECFDADGCLIKRKLDVLSFTEEVFFDQGDFMAVVNFLG
jgi:hypothetical protein